MATIVENYSQCCTTRYNKKLRVYLKSMWTPHFSQMEFRVGKDNFLNIHVSLVPTPGSSGQQKTKPLQNSIRTLRGLGLSPDLIICRCQYPADETTKNKVSSFASLLPSQVIIRHVMKNSLKQMDYTRICYYLHIGQ